LLEFRRTSENLVNQESELHPALATINSFKISLGKINKKNFSHLGKNSKQNV
jgi:hypothetical protein